MAAILVSCSQPEHRFYFVLPYQLNAASATTLNFVLEVNGHRSCNNIRSFYLSENPIEITNHILNIRKFALNVLQYKCHEFSSLSIK